MSVQVAVRVRPFNQREQDLNSRCVVSMNGGTTTLLNTEDPKKNKDFTFDFSFWSHDEFEIDEQGYNIPTSDKYADQRKVYDSVGQQILDNAWQGYHCCLFAYGQTGAGKSYSMIGYKPNIGIVPIACQEIFKRIAENESENVEYQVQVSMQEIYNEKIQDLLTPIAKRTPGGLKVRENKNLGFYVEGLNKVPVTSYEMIEAKMDEGSRNRTIASTEMNACSSRAHTIITIEFKSIEIQDNKKLEKFSVINLVDLAGSEKVGKTGATGDRLKEAGQINKSLTMLGMVISSLADLAMGKKGVKVPYRDSALTKILANALGGNSKTLMICAISPSHDNYEETLSTLRYADQAKKIKCKAVINESETDKIIRGLKEEINQFRQMFEQLQKMGVDIKNPNLSEDKLKQIRDLQDKYQSSQALMDDYGKDFSQKVKEHQNEFSTVKIDLEQPFLNNLNEDPVLNGKVQYQISEEPITIGRKAEDGTNPTITLNGMGIKTHHATIYKEEDEIFIEPYDADCGDYLFLNGDKVTSKQKLYHQDRLIFGTSTTFIVNIPKTAPRDEDLQIDIDWEFAQEELAQKADKIKKEEEERVERELEEEKQKLLREAEEKRIKEQEEMEKQLQAQKQSYEEEMKKLVEKMKEETEREKLEKIKAETEAAHRSKMLEIEAEKVRKELEREREKKKIQEDENQKKNKIKEKNFLEHKLSKYLPKILEVNLIAKELKRNITMNPKLRYDFKDINQINEDRSNKVKIFIQVQNREEGTIHLWDLGKFSNRYYIIKDILDRYFETNEIPQLQPEDDPFWDPPEPHLVGIALFKMLSLGHLLDNPVECQIVGDNGACGTLKMDIIPTDETGTKNLAEEMDDNGEVIEDPNELLDKRLDFRVVIESATLPPHMCKDSYVEYSLLMSNGEQKTFKTDVVKGKVQNPQYKYSQQHTYERLTQEIINYLQETALCLRVFGLEDIKDQQGQKTQEQPKALPSAQQTKPKVETTTKTNKPEGKEQTNGGVVKDVLPQKNGAQELNQKSYPQATINPQTKQSQVDQQSTKKGSKNDEHSDTKESSSNNSTTSSNGKQSGSNSNQTDHLQTGPKSKNQYDQQNQSNTTSNVPRSNTLQHDIGNKDQDKKSSKDKKKGNCTIF